MIRLGSKRFDLVREVGEGSSAKVFEGHDRETSSTVAIKVLHVGDDETLERFEREVGVLADLQHPSIVRYIAHGLTAEGLPYLVMEWLAGNTVDDHHHARWPIGDVVTLARRVSAGLAFAAERGVIHRDVKPANLFLVNGAVANAKIVDFGIARRLADQERMTHAGMIVGTPLFMSPEQARGERVLDAKTDVFSLGSVLYTCLCGVEPFLAHQPLAVLARICFEEPVPIGDYTPDAPTQLQRLIEGLLRKDRAERLSWRAVAEWLSELPEVHASAERSLEVAPARPSSTLTGTYTGQMTLSRQRGDRLRILAGVFIGGITSLAPEVESEMLAVAANSGVKVERLLDGTRIALATKLGALEQTVVAARCALALRGVLPSQARFVVCTGRGSVGELQPLGELFDRAAAMLADTPAGEVRVDDSSAALLEARFELGPKLGAVHTLERERSGGEAPRTLLGRPTPFIGRERELQQLQLIWNECNEELVARAVLVTAAAGSGKSRLRYELIERLRLTTPRLQLLVGRGDPMLSGTQFGVLAAAIRAWAELGSGDSSELKQSKLSARVAAIVPEGRAKVLAQFLGEMIGVNFSDAGCPQLKAARIDHQLMGDQLLASWLEWCEAIGQHTPVLFCLEDLHWSDPASLRFIEASLRSSRERTLLVLALARPEVHEMYPRLWAEREVTEIRLARLSARASGRILETLGASALTPELQSAIIERADGNPFVLEELVRAWKTPHAGQRLPDTILAIVQARLDALGAEQKLLIQAGSIFGQTFRLVGVQALLGDDKLFDFEVVIAMLCQREIIFRNGPPGDQEYTFHHALIREAAYLLQSDEERALGHRLAAGWLEDNAAAPALLADHYERGGALARAAMFWARAAWRAFEAGSLEEITRCGERSIACGVDGEELGNLAALLAEACSYRDDDAGAAEWAARARQSLPEGSGGWWRATQVSAISYLRRGAPEFESLLTEMLELPPPEPALPERAMAIGYIVNECVRLMRNDVADKLFALVTAEGADSLGGRSLGCLASARAVRAFGAGKLSEALRHAHSTLDVMRRAGALRDVAETLGLCGYLQHELGAYEAAAATFTEQQALGQRIGSPRDIAYSQLYLGVVAARQGQLDEAERGLLVAADGYHRLMSSPLEVESLTHLVAIACARGDFARAREMIARAQALGPVDHAPTAYLTARASIVALLTGHTSEALVQARNAYELAREHGVTEFLAIIAVSYVEALLANGERGTARDVLSTTAAWLDQQAAKIDEPAARQSYLTHVQEHARVRELLASV